MQSKGLENNSQDNLDTKGKHHETIDQTKHELLTATKGKGLLDDYDKLPWEKQLHARVFTKHSGFYRHDFRSYFDFKTGAIVITNGNVAPKEYEIEQNQKLAALEKALQRPENVWLFSPEGD